MKHLLIITISLIFSNYVYSQASNSKKTESFLTNNAIKLTPSQVISNFRIADESWIRYDEYSDPVPFESAYELNVFDYFQLNETYDSDLKKEDFKQTVEYKALLDSLKSIKTEYLNSVFYQKDFNYVGEETFEMKSREGDGYQINYDLQKKGFFIGIGSVFPYHCSRAFCPKVIEEVEFKQILITKNYNLQANSNKSYTQNIFIPLDMNTGLEIENNRSQIEALRIFNIRGVYTAAFNDPDFTAENPGKTCKVKVVKGGDMRLLIYNKTTKKIYFDKIYPATQSK